MGCCSPAVWERARLQEEPHWSKSSDAEVTVVLLWWHLCFWKKKKLNFIKWVNHDPFWCLGVTLPFPPCGINPHRVFRSCLEGWGVGGCLGHEDTRVWGRAGLVLSSRNQRGNVRDVQKRLWCSAGQGSSMGTQPHKMEVQEPQQGLMPDAVN